MPPAAADAYPLPAKDPVVEVSEADVKRWLGIEIPAAKMAELLARLEFKVEVKGDRVSTVCPDHRLDINEGVVGKADLVEEIARVYGYDNIPEEALCRHPAPQIGNPVLVKEERVRDLLVAMGVQEASATAGPHLKKKPGGWLAAS